MSEIASASINSFGKRSPEAVSPEETFLEIPASALQDLLGAIQELKDEVAQLREERAQDHQELDTLRRSVASLVSTQEQDTTRICLDIAYDRQRLAKLEMVEPQPLQKDRGEILRALLAANGGKMLAKDARQKMRLDKATFSRLLDTLKEDISIKPLHADKRMTLLIIK